jgi:hypothetical protein
MGQTKGEEDVEGEDGEVQDDAEEVGVRMKLDTHSITLGHKTVQARFTIVYLVVSLRFLLCLTPVPIDTAKLGDSQQ